MHPGLHRRGLPSPDANSGLRIPVAWKSATTIAHDGPIRVRINWIGPHPEKTRLYAVYLE